MMWKMRRSTIGVILGVMTAGCSMAHGGVIVVDGGGSGDFLTIQAALNASAPGNLVLVEPGVYPEHVVFPLHDVVLRSTAGASVTTIDANGTGESAVVIGSFQTSETIIEGFTITGGVGTGGQGGGILCDGASALITDCIIRLNEADYGGGAAVLTGTPTFRSCVFDINLAEVAGGGVWVGDTYATIIECKFSSNLTFGVGGGLSISPNPKPVALDRSIFCGNQGQQGGGIDNGGQLDVVNSVLFGNEAAQNGGGVSVGIEGFPNDPTATLFTNCTIVANSAFAGAGIWNYQGSIPVYHNCVIWDNDVGSEGDPGGLVTLGIDRPAIKHSIVQNGFPGIGNIAADPAFVDELGMDGQRGTGDEDYRLGVGSPGIDAGDSTDVPAGVTTDADNMPRIVDATNYDDTGVPDGLGRVVDMGAYEAPQNTPAPCPGDANGDQTVDINDLNQVIGNFGTTGPAGDLNGDQSVDVTDLNLVLGNFGMMCS